MILYLLLNPLSKNIFKGSLGLFFLYLCLNFIIKLFSGLDEIVYEIQSIVAFLFATSILGDNKKRFLTYLYYFYLFNVLIVLLLNSPPYLFIDNGFINGQRTNMTHTLCLLACLLLSNNYISRKYTNYFILLNLGIMIILGGRAGTLLFIFYSLFLVRRNISEIIALSALVLLLFLVFNDFILNTVYPHFNTVLSGGGSAPVRLRFLELFQNSALLGGFERSELSDIVGAWLNIWIGVKVQLDNSFVTIALFYGFIPLILLCLSLLNSLKNRNYLVLILAGVLFADDLITSLWGIVIVTLIISHENKDL